MHGDLTRDTFHRERHFSSLRHQQGRVTLDADLNEQADIALNLERTAVRDQVGPVGAPLADPHGFHNFKVGGVTLADLEIAPGRIYVDGVLVENEGPAPVLLNEQPHLPKDALIVQDGDSFSKLADAPAGQYAVYLQVQDRHVTAIQEPALRDVALGGPDTATRVQTTWQVRLVKTDGTQSCVSAQALLPAASRGRLSSDVQPVQDPNAPCEPGGGGGYLGLENHLYRVEIHTGGALGTATFKWSSENGSVVVPVEDFVPEANPADTFKVIVASLGRDAVLGLAQDKWVELLDDPSEQLGSGGTLAKLEAIESAPEGGYVLSLSQKIGRHLPPGTDPKLWHPYLRRWDQSTNLQADGAVLTGAEPIDLEDGVQVKFSVDAGTGPDFRPGEYWLFDARTTTGMVDKLNAAPPRGSSRYALLAVVDWDPPSNTLAVRDCRPQFPAATDLVQLLYVGGDGQQGPAGQTLPAPLQVSVANGRFPVAGAMVRFTFGTDSGPVPSLDAPTDADGVATCTWTLGGAPLQTAEARLLLPDNTTVAPNPPVRFSAVVAVPGGRHPGSCTVVGPNGDFARLDEAVELLLSQGQSELCLCLVPGDHVIGEVVLDRIQSKDSLHLHVAGCGPGTHLHVENRISLRGLRSVRLEHLAVDFLGMAEGPIGLFDIGDCGEVLLDDLFISGRTAPGDVEAGGTLMSIAGVSSLRLRDVRLSAHMPATFDPLLGILQQVGALLIVEAVKAMDALPKDFIERAFQVGAEILGLGPGDRKNLAQQVSEVRGFGGMTRLERRILGKLVALIEVSGQEPTDLVTALLDLRRAAIKSQPGCALVLAALPEGVPPEKLPLGAIDRDAFAVLEGCEIAGEIGLYGLPLTPEVQRQLLPQDFLRVLANEMRQGVHDGTLAGDIPLPFGTLEARGCQLTRIGVARRMAEILRSRFDTGEPYGFFNEILLSDDMIEHEPNAIVALHGGLTGNQLISGLDKDVAFVFGISGTYIGNRGEDQVVLDVTQFRGDAANVRLQIV